MLKIVKVSLKQNKNNNCNNSDVVNVTNVCGNSDNSVNNSVNVKNEYPVYLIQKCKISPKSSCYASVKCGECPSDTSLFF
jgi:hypothetical protein